MGAGSETLLAAVAAVLSGSIATAVIANRANHRAYREAERAADQARFEVVERWMTFKDQHFAVTVDMTTARDLLKAGWTLEATAELLAVEPAVALAMATRAGYDPRTDAFLTA